MLNFKEEEAKQEIWEYATANCELVSILPGRCRYNFRCQMNAVHDAVEAGEDRIAMCMVNGTKGDHPYIHFVNVSLSGELVDNTLGHWSTKNTYRLIRYIPKEEFFDIESIFTDYRKFVRKTLKPVTRWFSKYEA